VKEREKEGAHEHKENEEEGKRCRGVRGK